MRSLLRPESRVSGWHGSGCSGRTPIYPTFEAVAHPIVLSISIFLSKIFKIPQPNWYYLTHYPFSFLLSAYWWPFLTKITFLHFIYFNFLLHLVDQRKVDTKMNSPSCFYFNYPDNCWLKGIRNCHLTRYNLKKSSGCLANFTSLFAILLNFGFSTFFFLLHFIAFLCIPDVFTSSRSWCCTSWKIEFEFWFDKLAEMFGGRDF